MLALRSIVRAVPRTAFRATPIRSAQRYVSISRPTILARTSPYKAFSTTRVWREAAGDADGELSAKLELERSLEVKETPNTALPQELEDFLADTQFKVTDQPGTENIILTKQFGNETVRVQVSIDDMNADREPEGLEDEDFALDDEDLDPTSGGKRTINQAGVRGGKIDIAPEDSIAPVDRDAGEAPEGVGSFTLNMNITIDKGAIGALNIIASAVDGQIEIEYVHYYPRADLIDPKTAEASKEAQEVYGGPGFPYLDHDLQQMFEVYMGERGINAQLTEFLTRYVDYKEQREYVLWLENMKKFIDA